MEPIQLSMLSDSLPVHFLKLGILVCLLLFLADYLDTHHQPLLCIHYKYPYFTSICYIMEQTVRIFETEFLNKSLLTGSVLIH